MSNKIFSVRYDLICDEDNDLYATIINIREKFNLITVVFDDKIGCVGQSDVYNFISVGKIEDIKNFINNFLYEDTENYDIDDFDIDVDKFMSIFN